MGKKKKREGEEHEHHDGVRRKSPALRATKRAEKGESSRVGQRPRNEGRKGRHDKGTGLISSSKNILH